MKCYGCILMNRKKNDVNFLYECDSVVESVYEK